ncbi:MAG: phosphatidate cytidylyltransferase [Phytoplasma sp.]|uniref:phosphatidate cytidylyltransferase n=1 Tax=Phytoplasma sp. TaxID=2155 RepID=UPI002B40948E|nr:phosphatidate cytidylyltransferase [Phytoplasma sp.]WRH06942.1 MAG: phosphatidate cytidylyltransferase [Phytoplasma sp.]
MKQKTIIKKIYIGIILFLINSLFFYFLTKFDQNNDAYVFVYFCLFFVLFIIIGAIKEILKSAKLNKNKFLQIPYFLFSFLFFFYSFFILLFQFKDKHIFNFGFENGSSKIFLIIQKIILFDENYFLFAFLFFFICLWFCFLFIRDFKTKNLNFLLLILFYIVFSNACFLVLVSFNYQWFLYLFVITIANDSFAFLGGILFGKHLLYPSVSPKKTWEGFFCGIIMTFIIVCFLFPNQIIKPLFLLFTLCNCVISQIGDLISSKFKRDFSVKDFDDIIPGHGGLLDRFDSLLFLSFFVILFLSSPLSNNI